MVEAYRMLVEFYEKYNESVSELLLQGGDPLWLTGVS